jgi:copper transport protein
MSEGAPSEHLPRRSIASRSASVMIRLLLLSLLLAAMVPGARQASAHAVLLESVPADGAVLATAPAEVLLRFDEPVTPIRVELLDAAGKSVASGKPSAEDGLLRLAPPAGLAEGSYLLSYRVTSLDSHPVAGSVVFSIGHRTGTLSQRDTDSAASSLWSLLSIADRLLLYVGLIGAAGGVLFHWLIGRDLGHLDWPDRRALVGLAALGLLAALLGIGIEGALLADAPGSGFLSAGLWTLGESTSLGLSLTIAAIALVALILAFEAAGGRMLFLAPPAALSALASLALTGHALTAGPLWLTASILLIHVLLAAFWLGALGPLWLAARRRTPDEALRLLRRFSTAALPAVALLIAAGATLAWLQLGRHGALTETAYGLRLTAKLAFVAVLLLVAALNRLWLTPALAAGRPKAADRLRASVGLEIALGLVILTATASLGETPPPRALAAEAAAQKAARGFSAVTFTAGNGALISVTPAARGTNQIEVHLFDAEGKPLSPLQVTVEIALPAAGAEPILHPLQATATGFYLWESANLPLAGDWTLRLRVLVSDFEETTFETSIPIR